MIENNISNTEPLPFESYPGQGLKLLGRVRGDGCRRGYGLEFMRLTKQTKCAYCGLDLTGTYENWLTMALDHVVPHSACIGWNLSEEWREDYSNRVLCCTACNTFGNRYQPKNFQCPVTLEVFYLLRDAIFIERRERILVSHERERTFFEEKRWMQ